MKNNSLNIKITRSSQVLIIMRGIPGSGKSTKAKELVGEGVIHSTDTVIESMGDYNKFFKILKETNNSSPLFKAHYINFTNAITSMSEGISPVIIDNLNLKASDVKAYVVEALKLGFDDKNIIIHDIGTNGVDAKTLAERNSHGVPIETIQKMIQRHKSIGQLTIKKILEAKDSFKNNVSYTGIVLEKASQNVLFHNLGNMIPDGWTKIGHHMTICFGPLKNREDVGKEVMLAVTAVGLSDMAMAVKVSGYVSKNDIPHVTVAINPNGGKPSMSNEITNWQPTKLFLLLGKITEVEHINNL